MFISQRNPTKKAKILSEPQNFLAEKVCKFDQREELAVGLL